MINTFITRLIQMKHQWLRLVLWLLLPLFLTWIVMSMIDQLQSESEVPVGIVLEEKTPLALELYEKIEQAPLIRTSLLSESTAQNKLLKHDLDSVFIIHEGYEQNIETDDRQELITGLKSNLSFAYIPTSEVIMSFVQEHAVRAKAAIAVEDLIKDYNSSLSPTMADIIKKSKDVQDNQDFLTTSFTLNGESHAGDADDTLFVKPWNIWALSTLLTTLFMFDWVIKEKRIALQPRFTLMRMSFKQYLLHNLAFYTVLLFIFDLLTAVFFKIYFQEQLSLTTVGVLLSYRLLLTISAFLLAICFKKNHLFYTIAFTLFLICAIISGAVFPMTSIWKTYNWLTWFNPVYAFIHDEFFSVWLLIVIVILILWSLRKGRSHA